MAGGVHGRGHAWQGSMHGRKCMWQGGTHGGGHAWQGWVCVAGGASMVGVCIMGGHAWQGACMARETTTVAGGTHPTGMHSCYFLLGSTLFMAGNPIKGLLIHGLSNRLTRIT